LLDLLDDRDDWEDCVACDAGAEGGADGATFRGGGPETLGRGSFCCCGLSTGADAGGGV
jgi:hypothetical protein